jgi:hypothetical protein
VVLPTVLYNSPRIAANGRVWPQTQFATALDESLLFVAQVGDRGVS